MTGRLSVPAMSTPFLVANMNSRVASLRAFFAFAKQRKVVLVDPTAGVDHRSPKGFSGRVLLRSEATGTAGTLGPSRRQRQRESRGAAQPPARAGSYELRHLLAEDIDLDRSRWSSGVGASLSLSTPSRLPPFEPASQLGSRWSPRNPHLIITKDSRMHTRPCSQYYVFHLFDDLGVQPPSPPPDTPGARRPPRRPRVLAIAFGLNRGRRPALHGRSVDHEELGLRGEAVSFRHHLAHVGPEHMRFLETANGWRWPATGARRRRLRSGKTTGRRCRRAGRTLFRHR